VDVILAPAASAKGEPGTSARTGIGHDSTAKQARSSDDHMRKALMASAVMMALASGAAAQNADTQNVTIGTTVTLTSPLGLCALDQANKSDAALMARQAVLAMYADCSQLKEWRVGNRATLDDYSIYSAKDDSETPRVTRNQLPGICDNMRKQRQEPPSGSYKENRFLGVIAEDQDVCFTAYLQRFVATSNAAGKTQLLIEAMTFVKGKVIFYFLVSRYSQSSSVDMFATLDIMLDGHKRNVAAFLAANR
jgi:hypothetical protein